MFGHLILPGKSQNLHFEKYKWVMLFFFMNSIFVIFSGRAYLWVQSGF